MTEATNTIGTIMQSAGDFTSGFIGMLGDAADAFMDHAVLMLFLFAIPLSMGAIAWVRSLIKKRKR